MRSIVSGILGAALGIAPIACTEDDVDLVPVPRECSSVMVDSLGVEYPTDQTHRCMPGIDEHSPVGLRPDGTCGGEGTPGILLGWGRFFEVCSACDNGTVSYLCRPLICEIDEDCPIFENRRRGHLLPRRGPFVRRLVSAAAPRRLLAALTHGSTSERSR